MRKERNWPEAIAIDSPAGSKRAVLRLAALATLACAAPFLPLRALAAGGADSIEVRALELGANFNTINIRLPFGGDADSNATVAVSYWKSSTDSTQSDAAFPLVRSASPRRFCGVIFWLEPGTSYTVRAVVTDPDGGGRTLTSMISTRATPDHSAGRQVWVSPAGSNSNDGLSASSPKQTIAGALLVLPVGGQIRLLPGVYYEMDTLLAIGRPDAYYSIVGNGDPDSVIIDGSALNLLNARWDKVPHSNAYSTTYAHSESIGVVVAGMDQRLHRKKTLDEVNKLSADHLNTRSGWFQSNGMLYVHLENDADPNQMTMHVGVRASALWFCAPCWRAESLTVRYTAREGMLVGSNDGLHLAHEAVIRNCRFHETGRNAVLGNVGTIGMLMDSCNVSETRVQAWGYFAGKRHPEESVDAARALGRASVIRNNRLTGTFDGIQVGGNQRDFDGGADTDIYDNVITNVADDGIEPESEDVNVCVWGNTVNGANHGLSSVPVWSGPIYYLYNVVVNCLDGGVKLGGGATGYSFYFHNTFWGSGNFNGTKSVGEPYANMRFANNILVGSGEFGAPINDTGTVQEPKGETETCKFDFDLLYQDRGGPLLLWHQLPMRTLAEVRSVLHWENGGLNAAPLFVDPGHGDFRLQAGSPAIDAGILIRGINQPQRTPDRPLYNGKFPDLGALEYGGAQPR